MSSVAKKIAAGFYVYRGCEIERVFTEWCNAWEWMIRDAETGEWWETVGTLRAAREYVDAAKAQ